MVWERKWLQRTIRQKRLDVGRSSPSWQAIGIPGNESGEKFIVLFHQWIVPGAVIPNQRDESLRAKDPVEFGSTFCSIEPMKRLTAGHCVDRKRSQVCALCGAINATKRVVSG